MWRRSAFGRLRPMLAAALAGGLMVLAAALVTPGGDVARVGAAAGPAIHPAAEITPNALPRTCPLPADDEGCVQAAGDGDDLGPLAATVAEPVTIGPNHSSRPVASAPTEAEPDSSEPAAGSRAPPASADI
ncbi:hypothetical protein [Jiangella asiatica]|uniref:Uncharacterized protein n=1 Tax=Jiangella asiatica TaxID=2530372 RepID=A0A4V2Z094_9ACTN|nr:hypothetical protein [Jiangella asiatica]TDE00078.1 hypothetical protein E1269_26525 [Jiangella asiatica]